MGKGLELLICTLAMPLVLAFGCKSSEVKKPILDSKTLQQNYEHRKVTLEEMLNMEKAVRKIVMDNDIPYALTVHAYHDDKKIKFYDELTTLYGFGDKALDTLDASIQEEQNRSSFFLISDERIGQKNGGVLIILPGIGHYLENKTDLKAMVKIYAATKLKYNAEGIEFNGIKLNHQTIPKTTGYKLFSLMVGARTIIDYAFETTKQGIMVSSRNKNEILNEMIRTAGDMGVEAQCGNIYALPAIQDMIMDFKKNPLELQRK